MMQLSSLFPEHIEETCKNADLIGGSVPTWVRGTWAFNGPARFVHGDLRYRHWLDGDGLLRSMRFGADGAVFRCRWAQSRKWREEQSAGRALYRSFGTSWPGDRLNTHGVGLESPLNVSIFPFADRMLAFGEQGLPYAVDGETLETIGPFTFNGALNEVSPFSAHPSIDRTSGGLVNFGISFSASRPSLNYYRFEADGTLAVRRRVAIPRPSSVHDFALGPRHAVVYLSPDLLDMSVMLSGGSVMDALSWRPENGSVLLILDRESGRQKALLDVGSGYCLHVVNCFESGGALVLDLLELDEPIYPQYQVMPELFETVGAARPVRYTIDTSTWAVTDKLEIPSELLYDFPVVHPQSEQQPTGSAWMVGITSTGRPGAKFLDRLARVDWDCGSIPDVYQSPEGVAVASEPMIVPHPRHRARAALLCRFIDTRQGTDSVLVFDAYDLAAGPRATLRLPTLTPPSFHGSWIADPPPEDRY